MFKYIKYRKGKKNMIGEYSRCANYLGTYQKEDEENALKELAQLKLIVRRLNKILKYEGVALHFKCRGRRGKNNTHPYFKDNPSVGHYDGSTPIEFAQRVDVYLNTVKSEERYLEYTKLYNLNYKVKRANYLVEELKNVMKTYTNICEENINEYIERNK
tara:strand:+ start:70 stop:546 length:477 start_codon:yes stop_codon:yes gene_type:complete